MPQLKDLLTQHQGAAPSLKTSLNRGLLQSHLSEGLHPPTWGSARWLALVRPLETFLRPPSIVPCDWHRSFLMPVLFLPVQTFQHMLVNLKELNVNMSLQDNLCKIFKRRRQEYVLLTICSKCNSFFFFFYWLI